MQIPSFGIRVLDTIKLDDIIPLIDLEMLFAARWQFRQGAAGDAWEAIKQNKAIPAFERMLAICRAGNVIAPRIAYGFFRCVKQGNALLVEGEGKTHRFDFPRERASPNRCISDYFGDGFITIQIATIGGNATREGAKLFGENAYSDMFFLKGLAAEAAEATAIFGQRHISRELGLKDDAGVRFSPGYPSFPSLFDQKKITALIKSASIGVSLTRTCQLIPEYATTAIVSFDPRATTFQP